MYSNTQFPTKCNQFGEKSKLICGSMNPSLTCRPKGRQWGRACGPVYFKNSKWIEESSKKRCFPIRVRAKYIQSMPYGFGIYARKFYPYGVPCVGVYSMKKAKCNSYFYPMLPTKPGKIYSSYTFNTRGPPYTCPRPCI